MDVILSKELFTTNMYFIRLHITVYTPYNRKILFVLDKFVRSRKQSYLNLLE